jgi:putative ABC transport system permease protein
MGGKRSPLRSLLVIFQFFISVILIISTIVIFRQLQFLQNERLGFSKENVIVIKNPESLGDRMDVFKHDLEQYPFVKGVSICNMLPGTSFANIGYGAEDVDFTFSLNIGLVDADYKDVLGMEMAQGRFFSDQYKTDSMGIVINEAALELLGYEDPTDKKINDWWPEKNYFHVIGVIRDFHYESMHQNIRPMGLLNIDGPYRWGANFMSVKVIPGDYRPMIEQTNAIWDKYASGLAFDYSLLKEDYNSLYKGEEQTRKLFIIFTILAIFIASLGLLALASFLIEQKTKEIGIRKTLGASIIQISTLLTKEFIRWVAIANVLAWPLAWYLMDRWLQNFEYSVDQSWWIFAVATVASLLIALLTVSLQTIKTTLKNPVDALRYE